MAFNMSRVHDPNNYRNCIHKSHTLWMCKPPVGTVVVNKLYHPDVVAALGGRTHIKAVEFAALRTRDPSSYTMLSQFVSQGLAFCVGAEDAVLSGTRGELWVSKLESVKRAYLVRHQYKWSDAWPMVDMTKSVRYGNEKCIPWVQIRSCGDIASRTCACFVPVAETGAIVVSSGTHYYNQPGVDHGLGDFVVCGLDRNDSPDMRNRWVVNGLVFGDVYDNRTWSRELRRTGERPDLPMPEPLFSHA